MVRPTHSLLYRHRRLLLASLTGSEGRGKLRPKRPASCRRFVVSGDLASPARIPNWEREEGKATSRAPGLVPSLRRLQQPSSPARIPNWERGEGQAPSQAPGLVPSLRHDPMMLLSQPTPDGEDSSIRLASSSTTHSTTIPVLHAFMAENVANAILGVSLAM